MSGLWEKKIDQDNININEKNMTYNLHEFNIEKVKLEQEILDLKLKKVNMITEGLDNNGIQKLRMEIEQLCKKIINKNAELSMIFIINNKLQADRINLEEEFDTLKKDKDNLSDDLCKYKSLVNNFKKENKVLKDKLNKLEVKHKQDKGQLLILKSTLRYKIGNAFVLAARPSKHTILLPFRVIKLSLEGLKRKFEAKGISNRFDPLINDELSEKQTAENKEKLINIDIQEVKKVTNIDDLRYFFINTNKKSKYEVGRILYRRYKTLGRISESIELLKDLLLIKPNNSFLKRELLINEDKLQLLKDENYKKKLLHKRKYHINNSKKILHVLNTSIPYLKNGYSIRSKYIVEAQKKVGIEPIVITRPGFPNDFKDKQIKASFSLIHEEVNSIKYYRCLPKLFMRYTPIKEYLKRYSQEIVEVAEIEKPFAIHSASNFINGLAGLSAAKKLNLPFIYEIRGFWELTTVTNVPLFKNSEEYQLAQMMETYLANEADKVIVISDGLKNELIRRGVLEEKISIVPNGVDCNQVIPKEYNKNLSKRFDVKNKFVIGYIGSIVRYEGLQTLIKALNKLREEGIINIKFLIAGDGNYKEELQRLTNELKLKDIVSFIGRIPHEEVNEYYSLFDLCVFPRLDEEVTKIVTPLKPLEAMACKKVVIGSNLDAIKELIIENVNGLIFDNTVDDLCNKIKIIYNDKNITNSIREKARKWVIENRDWNELALRYRTEYNELIEKCSYTLNNGDD